MMCLRKLVPVILAAVMMVMFTSAIAEQDGYCDPMPPGLADLVGYIPEDCLVLDGPDGYLYAFLIEECDSGLEGYRFVNGQWETVLATGELLDGSGGAGFIRHQAGRLMPDGTACGDDQGFDVVGQDGLYDSYHWDGEYYSLCGWYDPDRYSGHVMIQGTRLQYYPEGSTKPEYEIDTGDDLTMYSWTAFYQDRPAVPAEAAKRAAILPASIRDDLPERELVEYSPYNSGTAADAVFASAKYDEEAGGYALFSVEAHYDESRDGPEIVVLANVPLSEQLKDIPVQTLWSNAHELLTQPGAIDSSRIPIKGRVADYDVQAEQLILLTEDEEGQRRVLVAYQDAAKRYSTLESGVLPPDTTLDTYHVGENGIELQFNDQEWEAGFNKTAYGWRLDWVMGQRDDYTNYKLYWWGVTYNCVSGPDGNYREGRLIGTLDGSDLMSTDFVSLPRTLEALKEALNRDGWAVVCNPNPKDRLHLRPKPGDRKTSLGKFYNGTPVRILGTKGDWCQVQIGTDGPEGWMMKKYLVFGEQMNDVEPAFPDAELREEYQEEAAWANPDKTSFRSLLKDHAWCVMGIYGDQFILFNEAGECAYALQSWFGEGNG